MLVGRKNEARLEWMLKCPDPAAGDVDKPVRRITGHTRLLVIEALETLLSAGLMTGSRYATARVCRGLKLAAMIDAAGESELQAAAQARLEELARLECG